MKKIFFILFLLLLSSVAIVGSVVLKDGMNKKILILENGTMQEVDNTWETGDIFFFEIDGEVYLIDKDEVTGIGKADYRYYFNQLKTKAAVITGRAFYKIKAFSNSTTSLIHTYFSLAVIILGAMLVSIFILIIIRVFIGPPKSHRFSEPEPILDRDEDHEITRLDIVKYFLNIFKLQIEASQDASAKIVPLSSKSSGPNYIYELRIGDRGEWVKRRMTIGPLGEETGSKSKCFYVIYDVHLVVKIPTKPINDFDQYIESINKEGHIVEKLAPKECVIPKISVILNLIHKFPDIDPLATETLEKRYITWLRENTNYQNYLKIRNSFIFFMDFSKFYFLGHIIDNLHDLKDSIPSEIIENAETIWEVSKFKGRYGKIKEPVFFEIQEVYDKCEAETRKFLTDCGEASSISLFRIQSWFLTHLGGKEVKPKDSGIRETSVPGLNRLIRKILQSNQAAVESYRNAIKEYVYKIRFEQNKPLMAGIVTNLLDLLAWLRAKQVSMRDLKPDNLLVAGDPSKYPLFLMSPKEYTLGIIDVETAVDFEKSKYKKTEQPLLGGTPFYATPSHFFTNETLSYCFQNFRKILHYQDWHAMVVMIFKAVTGDLLFEQTARMFGYVKDKIRQSHSEVEEQAKIVKDVSREFWRSASTEFQAKLDEKEEALKSIHTIVPDSAKRMFLTSVAQDQKTTIERIRNCITAQAAFQSDKSRDLLIKSSHAKIIRFRNHLKDKFKASANPSIDASKVLEFIDDLTRLKHYSDQQKHIIILLNQPESKMSTYDLLTFMFYTVYHTMIKEEWQKSRDEDICVSEPLDDEATTLEAYP
jgi:serine/threonine protein kinase